MARTFTAASSQYLSVGTALITAYPSTFACWFNPTTISINQVLMDVGSVTGSVTDEILLWVSASNRVTCRDAHSTSSDATAGTNITSGAWHHCAGVHISSTSRLVYFNGVSVSNAISQVPASLNRTVIGARFLGSSTATLFSNGSIAFAAIWNIDLSASDIASLFSGASPKIIRPDKLLSYEKLTGGTSPEPDFLSATAWTLTGSPTQSVNPRIYFP